MDWKFIVPLVLTAIVAVGGWYAAHRLSMNRDRLNKRRELRVKYLIDAYRLLETVSNRPISEATAPQFESAIADIQLFGSRNQVRLAQEFASGIAAAGTAPLDELLQELRKDLRAELELLPVPSEVKFLRIVFDRGRPKVTFDATISEQLDSINSHVQKLEARSVQSASLLDIGTVLERWTAIANAPISATEKIVSASVFLERSLLQAGAAAGIEREAARRFQPRRVAQQLAEIGVLSENDLQTFRELYDIRNRLVHHAGGAADEDAARFLDLVWRFVQQLSDQRGA